MTKPTTVSRKDRNVLWPQAFEVEPIGATIGAEVHGLDLSLPLDEATRERLEETLIRYKVIYVRGQKLTSAQHVALGRQFGELEFHPFGAQGETRELLVLDNH